MKDNQLKQKTPAGWKIATVLLATTTVLSLLGCYQIWGRINESKEHEESKSEIVNTTIPKLKEELKAIQADNDSTLMSLIAAAKNNDTSVTPPATSNQLDTVEYALNKAALRSQLGKARDSINLLRSLVRLTANERDEAREARRNISVERIVPGKQVFQQNASIGLYEFSKKNVKNSLFSPERNYLRITNNVDNGVVNGLPYLDYELKNDEIYQFMVQARLSYSPNTGRKLVGVGGELKLNKVSINVVNNFDGQAKRKFFNPSFGLRYDILSFPLK